jgi:hypothetical protein
MAQVGVSSAGNVRKQIAWAAAIGFFVPVFWSVLGFILFNARESVWTDIFWDAVHITCPLWYLDFPDGIDVVAQPLLNATLYGFVAFVWLRIKQSFKSAKDGSV